MKKTVLITGCSSGFGLAITRLLLDQGWRVLAGTRHPDVLTDLQKITHDALTVIRLDVTNPTDRQNAAELIASQFSGQLDCLINNSGYGLVGPLEEVSESQIRSQLEVNLFGAIFMTRTCLPFLRHCHGRIINISSVLGYLGFPLQSIYVTSKFAMEGLSESLYYELAPQNIQVTLVEPGSHRTGFGENLVFPHHQSAIPAYQIQNASLKAFRKKLNNRKSGSAEDVAHVVLRLLGKSKMPVRIRVGLDAHLIYYAKKMLPSCLSEALTRYIYQRIFLSEK